MAKTPPPPKITKRTPPPPIRKPRQSPTPPADGAADGSFVCPRCRKQVTGERFYGPCKQCRNALRNGEPPPVVMDDGRQAPTEPRPRHQSWRGPSDAPIHLTTEVTTQPGKPPTVKVGCGLHGFGYCPSYPEGLRSTVWQSNVTCPDCLDRTRKVREKCGIPT